MDAIVIFRVMKLSASRKKKNWCCNGMLFTLAGTNPI
jgi:hypothetical protein